jgi:hypothetical protein
MATPQQNIPNQDIPLYGKYRLVMAILVLAGHLSVGLNIFAVSPLLSLAI